MNKILITGRMVADPELRVTQGGKELCPFTIAVDRHGKGADFIDCTAWNRDTGKGNASFVANYFHKGKPIEIEGTLATNTYEDKNGNKVKKVYVEVDRAGFVLGDKGDTLDPYGEMPGAYKTPEGFTEIEDEDIPF